MKFKVFSALCLAGLVSACTDTEITQAPVDVTFASKSASQGLAGYHSTKMRAFLKEDTAKKRKKAELTGVPCIVKGSGYSAKFVTPAIVNLPTYGGSTRAVNIVCDYNGQKVSGNVIPKNLTSEQMMASSGQGGLLGVLLVASIDAARDKSADKWGYIDYSVGFD